MTYLGQLQQAQRRCKPVIDFSSQRKKRNRSQFPAKRKALSWALKSWPRLAQPPTGTRVLRGLPGPVAASPRPPAAFSLRSPGTPGLSTGHPADAVTAGQAGQHPPPAPLPSTTGLPAPHRMGALGCDATHRARGRSPSRRPRVNLLLLLDKMTTHRVAQTDTSGFSSSSNAQRLRRAHGPSPGVGGAGSFQGLQGALCGPLPASASPCVPSLVTPGSDDITPTSEPIVDDSDPLPPSPKDPCDDNRPPDDPGQPAHLWSLTQSRHHARRHSHRSWGLGGGCFWGARILPTALPLR